MQLLYPTTLRWRRRALALLLGLLVPLMGCERRPSPAPVPPPATGPTPSLAVLSPGLADILRDLGEGDAIVARHNYDAFTDRSVPAVGDQGTLDYEALLRARPSAVVLEQSATPPPERLIELGAASGWRVEVVPLLSLDDIRAAIARMGVLSGAQPDRVRDLASRFDAACAPSDALAPLGRTLVLVGDSPPGAVGPGSLHYELVHRLGAQPVPEDGAPFIRLSLEDIARLDPDSIILFDPEAPRASGADAPPAPDHAAAGSGAALPALSRLDLRAIRGHRLIIITDPKALLQSTAIISISQQLREQAARLPTQEPAP